MKIDGLTKGSLLFCAMSILAFWISELRVGASSCWACDNDNNCIQVIKGKSECVSFAGYCSTSGQDCC